MNLNIKDVYLMKNNQFILLVTYTPGLDISYFKNLFIKELLLTPIFLDKINTIPTNIDNIKFDKLNDIVSTKINDHKNLNNIEYSNKLSPNLVIFGLSFPNNKLNFKPDLHIHLSISKNLYDLYINDDNISYNTVNSFIENNNINKYYNIKSYNKDNLNEILDNIFLYIINFWEKFVYTNNYIMYESKMNDIK